MLDLEKMKKDRKSQWRILAKAYEEYVGKLEESYRVDFSYAKEVSNFLGS